VSVRTGEEIELSRGTRVPNVLAIEYSGSLSADSHWLQFVWFELVATTPGGPVPVSGTVPTSSGNLPFTTNPASPAWAVDSGSGNPLYASGGANIRDSSSTTIFDAPGGGSVLPFANAVFGGGVGATSVRFIGHFETYLIQRNQAAYRVRWTASTAFTRSRGNTVVGAIGYSILPSGPVAALPGALATLLHARYPAYTAIH